MSLSLRQFGGQPCGTAAALFKITAIVDHSLSRHCAFSASYRYCDSAAPRVQWAEAVTEAEARAEAEAKAEARAGTTAVSAGDAPSPDVFPQR